MTQSRFCTQVSFCEKTTQGQRVLCRDFERACVFTDQWGAIDPSDKLKIQGAKTREDAVELVKKASYNVRAQCRQHNYLCKLNKSADLCLFGAPCVDDSNQGKQKKDDGNSRLDPWFLSTVLEGI